MWYFISSITLALQAKFAMDYYYYIDAEAQKGFFTQQINRALEDIDERLRELEFQKAAKSKKRTIDRAQKMVLLKELGVLEYLFTLEISQKNLSKILSLLLDLDPSNVEKDLSARNDPKSYLLAEKNYSVVVNIFKELRMKNYEAKCQIQLDRIEAKKV